MHSTDPRTGFGLSRPSSARRAFHISRLARSFVAVAGLPLYLLLLTGCAATGRDVALVVEDSGWKARRQFGRESFEYRCPSGIVLDAPRFVVSHETHRTGLIVPIAPLFTSTSNSPFDLAFELRMRGAMSDLLSQLQALEISLVTDSDTYAGKVRFHGYPGEARLFADFPVQMGALERFDIAFSLPLPGCGLSRIHYVKQDEERIEFTAFPGP